MKVETFLISQETEYCVFTWMFKEEKSVCQCVTWFADSQGLHVGRWLSEMEKAADAADTSVLFFSAGANFRPRAWKTMREKCYTHCFYWLFMLFCRDFFGPFLYQCYLNCFFFLCWLLEPANGIFLYAVFSRDFILPPRVSSTAFIVDAASVLFFLRFCFACTKNSLYYWKYKTHVLK